LIELSCDIILKSELENNLLIFGYVYIYSIIAIHISIFTNITNMSDCLSNWVPIAVYNKSANNILCTCCTELVEIAFSSYIFIKNKYRNKLNAALDLRLYYLASFDLDFKKLCNSKQGQGCH